MTECLLCHAIRISDSSHDGPLHRFRGWVRRMLHRLRDHRGSQITETTSATHDGWIVEDWPTFGGGVLRIILCFHCRGLIPHESELDSFTPHLDLGVTT